MPRYLITGAQGFIGRHLAGAILEGEPAAEVLGIGRSPRSDRAFTHAITGLDGPTPAPVPAACRVELRTKRYRYSRVDIGDRHAVVETLRSFAPDVVVHLASGLRDDPIRKLVRTNVEGTAELIEAIGASGMDPPRFVQGSSGGVYGVPDTVPIVESARCEPIDPYSATKLAAEHCARVLATRQDVPLVVARIFNVVGPGQEERHVCGHLASQLHAIRRGAARPVLRLGATDTTRDFVDVRDVARALLTLSRCGRPGTAYNVGSGVETAVRDLLPRMIALAGLDGKVEVQATAGRRADIPRHVANVDRLRALGFRPGIDLDRSLRDTLEHYGSLTGREEGA